MNTKRSRSASAHSADSAIYKLKGEAAALQAEARARGESLSRGAALEAVAARHGFRDWNTACAMLELAPDTALRRGFEQVDQPLASMPIRIHMAGDRIYGAIQEVYRWAQQLEFIATHVDEPNRRDALTLVGGERPYAFVRDVARWSDNNYRLCDRAYDEFHGLVLTRDELDAVGVAAWEQQVGNHGGGSMFSVIHDDVITSRDDVLLKKAARLLASLALAFDAKLFGGRR